MNTENLPRGVRMLIYSFLDFKSLLSKAMKVSKGDREAICVSEIVNQDKPFTLRIDRESDRKGWHTAIDLATRIRIVLHKFQEEDVSLVRYALEKKCFEDQSDVLDYNLIEFSNSDFDIELFVNTCGPTDMKSVNFSFLEKPVDRLKI